MPSIVSSPFLALLLYLGLPLFLSVCPQSSPRFWLLFHLSLCKPKKPPHRAEPEAGVLSRTSSDPWADGGTCCPSPGARLAPPPGAGRPWERRAEAEAEALQAGGRGSPPRSLPLSAAPSRAAPPREPHLSSRLPQRPRRRLAAAKEHRAARPPRPPHLQTFPGAGAGE